MDPSKIEWDRIPTDPFFGSCDRAIREPQVFSGSVDRGSDRWRFLGMKHMGVSKNSGTPKSSIIIGFSIINHPFWGTLIFGNPHMGLCRPSSFLLPPPSSCGLQCQDDLASSLSAGLAAKDGAWKFTQRRVERCFSF